ncbi:hypothetical protein BCR32DRAFT_242848 [Anaeromyces robustus]|uniref:G-protein coupled receptors family 3 profile domain-containing protein n=1 Tax=Anaeromyces robustus TaxID=1754192 RepID=A0A1Y1XFF7_9FUNG|nr:hypothetical protein BCR32DRAFT_242848 [Anaeromyces robustus]|eukprot:ORX84146.1 hypothetical protein BCR32DRAFT_242848 [Anaeromyces robustus]
MLSLILLYIDKFDFTFLPKSYWFISNIGLVFILMLCIVKLGIVTDLKCHLYTLFMTVGYTFNIVPIFYKLIVCFPEKNKISNWIMNHKIIFFLVFVSIDILLNGIIFMMPYEIKTIINSDGENFEKCSMHKILGSMSTALLIIYKFLIIVCVLILIFTEWSMIELKDDLRFILSTIYIDIVCIIILLFLHFVTIRSYVFYLIIRISIIIVIAISNYIFIYGFRLFKPFINKKESMIIKGSVYNNASNHPQNIYTQTNKESGSLRTATQSSILSKLVNYHYKQSNNGSPNNIDESIFSDKTSNFSIPNTVDTQQCKTSTNYYIIGTSGDLPYK